MASLVKISVLDVKGKDVTCSYEILHPDHHALPVSPAYPFQIIVELFDKLKKGRVGKSKTQTIPIAKKAARDLIENHPAKEKLDQWVLLLYGDSKSVTTEEYEGLQKLLRGGSKKAPRNIACLYRNPKGKFVQYRPAYAMCCEIAKKEFFGITVKNKTNFPWAHTLLSEKDAVARELDGIVRARVAGFGVEVVALGIRDVILPGEMKDLMNKVTEAKKAAEAALITRREETAAMRSQANTAKILESSPTLMRLRELEVLEKVAQKANLTVVLGEKGLTDRVVKLL